MTIANPKLLFLKAICLLVMTFLFSSVFCQAIINGKISDDKSGEDLIGATVKIKGTSSGGVTDINGEFKITTNEQPPLTLEISYVGYTSKEVVVNSFTEKIKVGLSTTSMDVDVVEVVMRMSE